MYHRVGSLVVLSISIVSLCAVVSAQQLTGGRPASQVPGQKNVAGQPNGPATLQPQPIGPPQWFPLAAADEKYLNDVLRFWEFTAGQVQRYRCKFIRWEYDPITLPNDPDIAVTIAEGNIQYAAPDKGLFRVDRMWDAAREQRGNSTFAVLKDGKQQWIGRVATPKEELVWEHWVCDGKSIYEYNAKSKQIIQKEIPAELQGSKISDGPLPFLFGAKAATIKDRYWIHVVVPPPKEGRFCLEAIPKRREDAADFSKLCIFIDEKEFLPEALMLFHPGGSRQTYEFQNREKNWNMLIEEINIFHKNFWAPTPPPGWKLVKEPFQPNAARAGLPTAQTPLPTYGPRQATQGTSTPQRR